ncbi:hypothetical protein [Streptacidiphilus albus]|uniref:hypothetical protein n=1 Tax=Streptacidiphilus albus TaxID=105425 RepID=UPI000A86C340|nr:hypothetical protein [Streptacidiphilus albus]
MGESAQRFTQDLQALYAAAGSPPLSELVRHDEGQVRPAGLNDATMSGWLKGPGVPGPGSTRAFAVFVMLLEGQAGKRPGHARRSAQEWDRLRVAAHAERQAGRRGRTVKDGPLDPPDPDAPFAPVGVPIGSCDPLDLEVHPAENGSGRDAAARLPGYVPRAHDAQLAAVVAQAAAGRSVMAVLVGSSSTGKTRACWEAIQPLAHAGAGWRLWHPFDPTRADAALAGIQAVGPRTVVWLNEA